MGRQCEDGRADENSPRLETAEIVRLLDVAIIASTLDGTITVWNPAATRLLQYSADDMICNSISNIMQADQPDQLEFISTRIRAGKDLRDFDTAWIRKDGRAVDVSLRLLPVRDARGHVDGILWLASDTTERNRLRRAEHDQSFLQAIIASADEAIISKDMDGIITSWNAGAERIFGYTAQEALGKPVTILIPPEYPDEEPQILDRIRRGERIRHYETRRLRKDGRIIDISLTISPIKDRMGRIVGASKIARDITERNRLRSAEVAESFLAAIVDSAEDAIISKDLEGIVTSWNPAAERLYGYSAKEMIGKPIAMLIPPDHPNEEPQILQRIRRGEPIHHYETQRVRKDGRIIEVALTVSPIKDSLGRIVGASKIARDISERKAAEVREREVLTQAHEARWQAEQARQQAEAANRTKDEFLATISHELRTPITAVLGWSRMLLTGQLSAERQQKALETIDRNARSQAQLIEDLLDISRIVSGKLRIDMRAVDLAAIIAAAVEAVRPAAEAKRIRIESIIDSGAGPVLGDSERLQQVVWNLLSNAIKFTPRDGLVALELRRVESQMELHVTDNGIGISAEFLPHVFDRFSQADSSITRTRGGLGMGLAIVKSLVELHGGVVSAFSKGAGQGATFCIKLPISVIQRGAPQVPPDVHTELKARDDLIGLKILVVDDEPDASDMLAFVFNQCGAIVQTARSVKEALQVFDEWSPELLVSDIGMPVEDGYHLIRAIRQERGSRIPAVALTALARIEDRIKALMAGYQMHVSKPVEPLELITIAVSLVPLVNRDPDAK
jgi:PAS domain S-box-containing protein